MSGEYALYDSRIKWGMSPAQVKQYLSTEKLSESGSESIKHAPGLSEPDYAINTIVHIEGERCLRNYFFYDESGLYQVLLSFEFEDISAASLGILQWAIDNSYDKGRRDFLLELLEDYGFEIPSNAGDIYLEARWDELKQRVFGNLPPLKPRPERFYEEFFNKLQRRLEQEYGRPLVTRNPGQSGTTIWRTDDTYIILGYDKEIKRMGVHHHSIELSPIAHEMDSGEVVPEWYGLLREDLRPEGWQVLIQLEQLREERDIPHQAFALRVMSSPATTIKVQRDIYNDMKQMYPDQDEKFILTQVLASRVMPSKPAGYYGWSKDQVLQAMEKINTLDDLCRFVVSLDLREPATPDPWGIGKRIDEILGWKEEERSSSGMDGPSREEWGSISTNIAIDLEEVRKEWFDACIHYLKEVRDNDEELKEIKIIDIANTELGGKADLAIKAYQLYFVSCMLEEKGYISPEQGQDFADLLYAQVGGTTLNDCMTYWDRYKKATAGGTQLSLFCFDVASYITDSEDFLIESDFLATIFDLLVLHTRMVVASAFGDLQTVREIRAKLEKD